MSSKARFQPTNSGIPSSKTGKSTIGGRKTNATTANAAASTFSGSGKSGNIQVVYNGKILTPQSLISRKGPANSSGTSTGAYKRPKPEGTVQTIDETNEQLEKPGQLASKLTHKKTMAHELSTADKLSSKMTMGSIAKQKIIAEETCTMILSETLTDICLSLPSLLIATDTREVMQVDERNSRYEAVVKSHANVDGFSSRPTQTKNFPQKNQNEMAAPSAVKEAGTQATAYEIVDTIAKTVSVSADFEQHTIAVGTDSTSTGTDDSAGVTPSVRKFITDTVGMSLVTPGCLLDTSNVVKPPGFGEKGSKSEKRSKPSGGRNTSALSMGGGGSNLGNVGGAYGSTMDVEAITTGHSQQDVSGHTHHRRNSKDGLNPMASTASSGNNSNTGGAHNRDTTGKGAGSRTNIANEDSNASEGGGAAAASGPSFTEEDSLQIIRETEINKILTSAMLLKRLQMVERAIQQNKNHRSQLDYRDLPDISPIILVSPDRVKVVDTSDQLFRGLGGPEATKNAYQMKKPLHDNKSRTTSFSHTSTSVNSEMNSPVKDEHKITLESAMADSSNGPKVKRLFCYSNDELVQGRAVTCMVWNSVSTDLLAVGYGKIDTVIDSHKLGEILDEEKQGGLVLFWSLRNPDYPEKILRTKFPVTALAFSKLSPMILAVGLFNGDVCIYDVKRESNWGVPVESSSGMTNSHSDPVWDLKWVVKGTERLETLVSISTDGVVLEWNLKKGLVVSTLMQLKKSGTGEGWISNTAAGLCLDFHPTDPSTYVTGTEDGAIYRCSVSYNEQYLETYQGHEGPVNKVKFSQRWPSVFLSCSSDWNIGLYHLSSKNPILSIHATGEDFPVTDIAWCPDNSTVFACVTMDAKLQIWDLSVSSIEPVVTIDTTTDDTPANTEIAEEKEELDEYGLPSEHNANSNNNTLSPTLGNTRYDRTLINEKKVDEDNSSTLAKLLKQLAKDPEKKSLTTLQFGEKNPTIVVGDNRGSVSVYRIFDPLIITHLGPLQQTKKLKDSVMRLTDPASIAILTNAEKGEDEKK